MGRRRRKAITGPECEAAGERKRKGKTLLFAYLIAGACIRLPLPRIYVCPEGPLPHLNGPYSFREMLLRAPEYSMCLMYYNFPYLCDGTNSRHSFREWGRKLRQICGKDKSALFLTCTPNNVVTGLCFLSSALTLLSHKKWRRNEIPI